MAFGLNSIDNELDAVNLCLRAKGLEAATSVDLSDGDVADVVQWLDMMDQQVQSRGWFFNKDWSLTLPLDANSNVPLPAGTLGVANAYYHQRWPMVAMRTQNDLPFLYNLGDHNFVFPSQPVVDIIIRMDFKDLPVQARQYIAASAAMLAQGFDQANTGVINLCAKLAQDSLVQLEWKQDEAVPNNQIHQNLTLIGVLQGFMGLRRTRVI
jgi:hypothetical protein